MELVYQPQVALRDGSVAGVEALLRWRSSRRALLLPGEFIPIAEASGLIIPLGRLAIRQACFQGRQWCEAGLSQVLIAVNLSSGAVAAQEHARGYRNEYYEIMNFICAASSSRSPNASSRFLMKSDFLQGIGYLRRQGVSISIDYFGTGHSNLQRLLELPVDRINIDRSFVTGIGRRADPKKLHERSFCLVEASGKGGAEGVEQALQIDFLRSEGCNFAQGY